MYKDIHCIVFNSKRIGHNPNIVGCGVWGNKWSYSHNDRMLHSHEKNGADVGWRVGGNVQDVGFTEKSKAGKYIKYGSMLNIYILLKLYTFRSAHFTVGKL